MQRLPLDEFHDEVRQAFSSGAPVDESRDVWVFESRQDPALLFEPFLRHH